MIMNKNKFQFQQQTKMNIKSIQQQPNHPYSFLNDQQQFLTDEQHHFCYFDIRNQQTLITESVLMFLSLIIFIIAVKKYCQIWRMISDRNKNANLAYFGILAWWISIIFIQNILGYIAKDLYGVVIYIVYNQKDDVTQELSWFSKLYFSLDWVSAFTLQTILLFVPYHWMKQISQALSVVSGGDSQSGIEDNLGLIHYKGIEAKLYPKLKKYLLLRTLCIVPVILFLVLKDFQTISLISKILLSILLFDCLIIIIVLSLGLYSLRTNQLLKMQLDKDESKRLFNQYMIIIFSTFFRFGYDLFIFIYGAKEKLTEDNCKLKTSVSWENLVFNDILLCILAHYLPILIILRIYTVEEKQHDITKSLIME